MHALISPAAGAVKLASVFTDHMVLQRDRAVAVWGKADPGEKVTLKFAGQSRDAVADKDGRWRLKLEPMKANATAAKMAVVSTNGKQPVELVDICLLYTSPSPRDS